MFMVEELTHGGHRSAVTQGGCKEGGEVGSADFLCLSSRLVVFFDL